MNYKCSVCSKTTDETEFSLRSTGKPNSKCKECQRAYSKAHYHKNIKKRRAQLYVSNNKRKEKYRKVIKTAKDVPCDDCKVEYPSYVMDFHHVRGVKLFTIGPVAGNASVSMESLLQEIAKCVVICANCHRIRTHAEQYASAAR